MHNHPHHGAGRPNLDGPPAGHPGGHPGAKPGGHPGGMVTTLPDGTPACKLIAWEVTRSCNLACKHCRAEAHTEPYPGELSTEEAKALIVKALEFAPNDPFITDSLGWVEFRLGNRQEALTILKRAYETQPDAEIAAHIGEVLWSLGEHDRARDIWREGLRINKDNDTLKGTLDRLGVRL